MFVPSAPPKSQALHFGRIIRVLTENHSPTELGIPREEIGNFYTQRNKKIENKANEVVSELKAQNASDPGYMVNQIKVFNLRELKDSAGSQLILDGQDLKNYISDLYINTMKVIKAAGDLMKKAEETQQGYVDFDELTETVIDSQDVSSFNWQDDVSRPDLKLSWKHPIEDFRYRAGQHTIKKYWAKADETIKV